MLTVHVVTFLSEDVYTKMVSDNLVLSILGVMLVPFQNWFIICVHNRGSILF